MPSTVLSEAPEVIAARCLGDTCAVCENDAGMTPVGQAASGSATGSTIIPLVEVDAGSTRHRMMAAPDTARVPANVTSTESSMFKAISAGAAAANISQDQSSMRGNAQSNVVNQMATSGERLPSDPVWSMNTYGFHLDSAGNSQVTGASIDDARASDMISKQAIQPLAVRKNMASSSYGPQVAAPPSYTHVVQETPRLDSANTGSRTQGSAVNISNQQIAGTESNVGIQRQQASVNQDQAAASSSSSGMEAAERRTSQTAGADPWLARSSRRAGGIQALSERNADASRGSSAPYGHNPDAIPFAGEKRVGEDWWKSREQNRGSRKFSSDETPIPTGLSIADLDDATRRNTAANSCRGYTSANPSGQAVDNVVGQLRSEVGNQRRGSILDRVWEKFLG